MDWPKSWYNILWAPWRMTYISTIAGRSEGCFLCEAPRNPDERSALVLFKGKYSFIILNKYPYNTGHLMIAPYRHVASIEDLTEEEMREIGLLLKASVEALRAVYRPEGFNIGINIGDVAGAGVPGHIHVHVVPRWKGDANYITVVGGTKVISQTLEDTYDRLRPEVQRAAMKYGVTAKD